MEYCLHLKRGYFAKRYISANTHGNRPGENEVCNEMAERQDCVCTSCRMFSGMTLQAPGRTLQIVLGSVLCVFELCQAGWSSQFPAFFTAAISGEEDIAAVWVSR